MEILQGRRVPSLQLAGTPDRSTLDINALTEIGVKLVGRLGGISEYGKALFLDHYATCARFPILRWEDCSSESTNGLRKASMTRPARHIDCRQPVLSRRRNSPWT